MTDFNYDNLKNLVIEMNDKSCQITKLRGSLVLNDADAQQTVQTPEIMHYQISAAYSNDDNDIPHYNDVEMYISRGYGIASLITEHVLMHPFVVLRRQCQINPISKKYHIIPISLMPVITQIHRTQGLHTLWKGIGSVLLVRGLTMAMEDIVSKITCWPKEIKKMPLKMFGQHIILKCIAIGIVTPYYSSSLVETVQSDVASERPGFLDVIRDGFKRLFNVRSKGRLISIYTLIPQTITCGILKYLFVISVKSIASHIMRIKYKHVQKSKGAYSKDYFSTLGAQEIEMQSMLISLWSAEIVFYPLETIIQRLHLQGTRTIIDDMDTGRSVTAMLTDYSGVIDCYQTIISTEGKLGLYKGFGALIIQFAVHALILKGCQWMLAKISVSKKLNQYTDS